MRTKTWPSWISTGHCAEAHRELCQPSSLWSASSAVGHPWHALSGVFRPEFCIYRYPMISYIVYQQSMPISWFFQTSNQISTMELRKMFMPFEHLKILGSIVVQLMAGVGYVAAAALCKLSNKSEATGGWFCSGSLQMWSGNLLNWKYELRIIFRNKLSAMASPKRNPQKHWAFPVFLTRLHLTSGWGFGALLALAPAVLPSWWMNVRPRRLGHTACPLLGNVGDVFCAWSLHGLRAVSSIQLPIFSSVQDSGR